MNVPCYGCSKRGVGCHAICPDYKEFLGENEKRKEENRKHCAYNDVLYSYKKEKYHRLTGRKD
nr:MAG TPA: hypothetical protein [Caudoviricetes sp.]